MSFLKNVFKKAKTGIKSIIKSFKKDKLKYLSNATIFIYEILVKIIFVLFPENIHILFKSFKNAFNFYWYIIKLIFNLSFKLICIISKFTINTLEGIYNYIPFTKILLILSKLIFKITWFLFCKTGKCFVKFKNFIQSEFNECELKWNDYTIIYPLVYCNYYKFFKFFEIKQFINNSTLKIWQSIFYYSGILFLILINRISINIIRILRKITIYIYFNLSDDLDKIIEKVRIIAKFIETNKLTTLEKFSNICDIIKDKIDEFAFSKPKSKFFSDILRDIKEDGENDMQIVKEKEEKKEAEKKEFFKFNKETDIDIINTYQNESAKDDENLENNKKEFEENESIIVEYVPNNNEEDESAKDDENINPNKPATVDQIKSILKDSGFNVNVTNPYKNKSDEEIKNNDEKDESVVNDEPIEINISDIDQLESILKDKGIEIVLSNINQYQPSEGKYSDDSKKHMDLIQNEILHSHIINKIKKDPTYGSKGDIIKMKLSEEEKDESA